METIKTPCGHEYDKEVCPARRKAQIEFRKTGRRVDFPGCITCPHFVTKSADKPQEEKLKNKTKPETVRTCEEPGCNVVISKDNKSGLCRKHSCAKNQKQVHKTKPVPVRKPKNKTEKTAKTMPASKLCREQNIQNCHDCDDLTCDDNMRHPASGEPLPKIISGVLLYRSSPPVQMLPKELTSTRAQLLSLHKTLTEQARELMTRKNADYGANADPFANFRMSALLHIEPEFGVLLRMQDKMARLVSFLEKGELAVKEESWSDAIIDIINYSVLLCGLLQEKVNQGGAKL
jgi:hypothetical protein